MLGDLKANGNPLDRAHSQSGGELAPRCAAARRQAWHRAVNAAATLAIMLGTASAAWAKDQLNGASSVPVQKSYILAYILVGLCMAFGIAVVCRPGNRLDKEKRTAKEEFEEGH